MGRLVIAGVCTVVTAMGQLFAGQASPQEGTAKTATGPVRILLNMATPVRVEPPMVLASDRKEPKARYVWVSPGPKHKKPQGGSVTYEFEIKVGGEYRLWGRTWWCCGCQNALRVQVDAGRRRTLGDGTYRKWHWLCLPRTLKLRRGRRSLRILNRTGGAKIIQVLMVLTAKGGGDEYVPVGFANGGPENL